MIIILVYLIIIVMGFHVLSILIGSRKMNNKSMIISFLLILIIMINIFPLRLFSLDPSRVTHISIHDGNTGQSIKLVERDYINYIISNLNQTSFRIKEPAAFRMGFGYRMTIYSGEVIKTKREFIINSNTILRDFGFFWKENSNSIDYDFIKRVVKEKNESDNP